jgi:mRNA interferase RelE/StbE
LAWRIEYGTQAVKDLEHLDKPVRKRVVAYLHAVSLLDDPRQRGKALTGNLSGLWRYRVGQWRVICLIDDGALVVLALSINNRADAY